MGTPKLKKPKNVKVEGFVIPDIAGKLTKITKYALKRLRKDGHCILWKDSNLDQVRVIVSCRVGDIDGTNMLVVLPLKSIDKAALKAPKESPLPGAKLASVRVQAAAKKGGTYPIPDVPEADRSNAEV